MPDGYKHFSKTKPMRLEHFAPVCEWWSNRSEILIDDKPKAQKFTFAQIANELGYNLDQCGFPHEEQEILDPIDLIQRYQEERASINANIDKILDKIMMLITAQNGDVK